MSKINRNPAEENLMNQTDKIKETDLYPPVKKWLEDQGFEVFPEVQHTWGSNIIDVVGIKDKVVIAVELKTIFGLKVIQQAYENKEYCTFSYVAVPHHDPKIEMGKYKKGSEHNFAKYICRQFGIGVLPIDFEEYWSEDLDSIIGRKVELKLVVKENKSQYLEADKHEGFYSNNIIKCCDDFRRKYQEKNQVQAGSNRGGHLTAYKTSILNMIEYLSSRPEGASIKEIAQNVKLHWERPSVSIPQAIKNWESKTFEIRQENGKNKVFLISK